MTQEIKVNAEDVTFTDYKKVLRQMGTMLLTEEEVEKILDQLISYRVEATFVFPDWVDLTLFPTEITATKTKKREEGGG